MSEHHAKLVYNIVSNRLAALINMNCRELLEVLNHLSTRYPPDVHRQLTYLNALGWTHFSKMREADWKVGNSIPQTTLGRVELAFYFAGARNSLYAQIDDLKWIEREARRDRVPQEAMVQINSLLELTELGGAARTEFCVGGKPYKATEGFHAEIQGHTNEGVPVVEGGGESEAED